MVIECEPVARFIGGGLGKTARSLRKDAGRENANLAGLQKMSKAAGRQAKKGASWRL